MLEFQSFIFPLIAIAAIACGLWLWLELGIGRGQAWMHAKLGVVILLLFYHAYCGVLLRTFEQGRNTRSDRWYRWFNEFPVLGKTGTCSNDGTRFGWFASYADTQYGRIVAVFFLEGGRPTFGPKAAELTGVFYRDLWQSSYFAAKQAPVTSDASTTGQRTHTPCSTAQRPIAST